MGYDLLFQRAVRLHEEGYLNEAEQIYRQILETAPEHPDVLNLLGLVAQAKGIHEEAAALFTKAIKQSPDFAPFYFNLAVSLNLWGKPVEALDAYNKALSLKPDFKEACNNIGGIYETLKQPDNAEKAYKQAIQIDSAYAEPQLNLAMMKKDFPALKDLSRKFGNEPLVFFYLGEISFDTGRLDEALDYFKQAEQLAPQNSEIKVRIGTALLTQKQTAAAKQKFEEALALEESVPALINLANIESEEADYHKAESLYKRALDLKPNDIDARLNYADMLYREKRLHEALEEYRNAVILNPDIPEISNNLGIILKDFGEYEEALGLFFNALLKKPEQEEFSVNIAETIILLSRNDKEKALKIAENWQKQSPKNVFARHTTASFKGEKIANTEIYSQKLFDTFADNYELVLENIGYNVVRELRNLTGNVKGTVVDLGCGTGLVGETYKAAGTELIGVDISEKMLEKARGKKLYKELIHSDIKEFLQNKPSADLFIAADVFGYIGSLNEIFKLIYPARLAFSIEEDTQTPDYALSDSGRYKHNPLYINDLLKSTGYTHIQEKKTILRQENGKDVQGRIYLAETK